MWTRFFLNLVFDLTWPSFDFDLKNIKINILICFQNDWARTMVSRVYTIYLWFDLVLSPRGPKSNWRSPLQSFWWSFRNTRLKLRSKILTRFSFDWTWRPSFWRNIIRTEDHQGKHSDRFKKIGTKFWPL